MVRAKLYMRFAGKLLEREIADKNTLFDAMGFEETWNKEVLWVLWERGMRWGFWGRVVAVARVRRCGDGLCAVCWWSPLLHDHRCGLEQISLSRSVKIE